MSKSQNPHQPTVDSLTERRKARTGQRHQKAAPNVRMQRLSVLYRELSSRMTEALERIAEQESVIGFPTSGGGDRKPARMLTPTDLEHLEANPDYDPTGDGAMHAYHLRALREDLRDYIAEAEKTVTHLSRLLAKAINTPLPGLDGVKLCNEGQMGRDGAMDWGDPLCSEIPVKRELCSAHYQAERKWRMANDMPGREEPAA